jgi:hypothetical protein
VTWRAIAVRDGSWWFLIMVVCDHGGLGSWWFVIMVVSNHGGLGSWWFVIMVV